MPSVILESLAAPQPDLQRRLWLSAHAVNWTLLWILLAFEPVTERNRFKLYPYSVHDGNHGSRLEFKSRQH